MTTALRSTDCTERYVTDLERQIADLHRDLASQRARNRGLFRELRRALDAPKLLGQSMVGGLLTLTYDNGRVVQLQATATYTDDATTYDHRWVELTPAPDTPKAIVTKALDGAGLDDDGEPYDPTFRALAGLALHGMSVSAGEEQ